MASIMFTDFKGFTQIAESLRPKDLIAELDRCFVKFDEVIEKYGLEKIKTIGDSYMCAGGLPIRNKSNPVDIVLAGLEIQRFIEELRKEKLSKGEQFWELRIGINTGEVIAGVVGIKRFAYDIWGDSVNVASRMEMHGEVGKVNISGKTYGHVKDYFDCTYRGKVLAKNKGEIDMYYVDCIKPELSENNEGIFPNDTFRSNLATVLFYKINYKKAEQFIMKKLEDELPDDLFYHAINHTIDVRDSAEKIGILEGVDGEDMMVLKTAAMYHDAGFTKQYFKNEPIGVAMSKEILPNFGYSPEQIETIEKMIMATQVPQTASTLLEKILCDADLDYLGRDDFYTIGNKLKKELMARNIVKDNKQWDELQISFLQKHKYFTDSSKNTREPEKLKRLEEIKNRFAEDNYLENKTNSV
jgi:class 3 adenylate cyclase/HD superfamily phosphodiesterase